MVFCRLLFTGTVQSLHLHEGPIDFGSKVSHPLERATDILIDDLLIAIVQLLPCNNLASISMLL